MKFAATIRAGLVGAGYTVTDDARTDSFTGSASGGRSVTVFLDRKGRPWRVATEIPGHKIVTFHEADRVGGMRGLALVASEYITTHG